MSSDSVDPDRLRCSRERMSVEVIHHPSRTNVNYPLCRNLKSRCVSVCERRGGMVTVRSIKINVFHPPSRTRVASWRSGSLAGKRDRDFELVMKRWECDCLTCFQLQFWTFERTMWKKVAKSVVNLLKSKLLRISKQKNLHVVLKTENKQRDCARTPLSRTSSSQLTANVAEIKTRKKNILICIFILWLSSSRQQTLFWCFLFNYSNGNFDLMRKYFHNLIFPPGRHRTRKKFRGFGHAGQSFAWKKGKLERKLYLIEIP